MTKQEQEGMMSIDLSQMTRKELEKLHKDIDKQIEKIGKTEQKAALEAAERAAREHGYTLSELTGSSVASKPKSAPINPPKYRNPADPTQTWTGKGRRPEWIRAAQERGDDLSRFEIAG